MSQMQAESIFPHRRKNKAVKRVIMKKQLNQGATDWKNNPFMLAFVS